MSRATGRILAIFAGVAIPAVLTFVVVAQTQDRGGDCWDVTHADVGVPVGGHASADEAIADTKGRGGPVDFAPTDANVTRRSDGDEQVLYTQRDGDGRVKAEVTATRVGSQWFLTDSRVRTGCPATSPTSSPR